jgi:hypothetical protein
MKLTRFYVIGLSVVCLVSVAMAEEPYEIAWTAQIGTAGRDTAQSMAVDSSGNVYICGETEGDLGGPNEGGKDVFLNRYDAFGNELWSRQIGTSGHDTLMSVALDAAGNAYITGTTTGDLGGINSGGSDVFLTKFDSSGDELWSQQIGSPENDATGSQAVAVDAAGNAYITGLTRGDLAGTNAGRTDIFLTKFDSLGNELWRQQIGTSDDDISRSVAVDAAGNAYICGDSMGDLAGVNAGYDDVFLMKFDASGNELWRHQFGAASRDHGYSMALDGSGAYITGSTTSDLAGVNAGETDVFLMKLDASGNELWSHQIGTSVRDISRSVAVDAAGNAYICGDSMGDLAGVNAGYFDAFLMKFDALGNQLWHQQIGTSGLEVGYAVAMDAAGNAYISGLTEGDLFGTNAGGYDAFLVKFENPVPEPVTMSMLVLGGVAMLRRKK